MKKVFNIEKILDENKNYKNINTKDKVEQQDVKIAQLNQTISYNSFLKKIEGQLTFRHQIKLKESGNIITRPGKFTGILIAVEKINGRFKIKVFNLPTYGIDIRFLLTQWKVKYGTFGTIDNSNTNKNIEKVISLRGVFIDEIRNFLKYEYKIEKSMIKTVNKFGKTKNKK